MGGATVQYTCKTSHEVIEYINAQYKLATEFNMVLDYIQVSCNKNLYTIDLRVRK
uniref:Uncharacterized protein n=1 Tax=viral metagenome TaxID=1070528 RepID=A0A6M3JND1_9ZZZZ